MADVNELHITCTAVQDAKSGEGKRGPWASVRVKIQGEKYYETWQVEARGQQAAKLRSVQQNERLEIWGELERGYAAELKERPPIISARRIAVPSTERRSIERQFEQDTQLSDDDVDSLGF